MCTIFKGFFFRGTKIKQFYILLLYFVLLYSFFLGKKYLSTSKCDSDNNCVCI